MHSKKATPKTVMHSKKDSKHGRSIERPYRVGRVAKSPDGLGYELPTTNYQLSIAPTRTSSIAGETCSYISIYLLCLIHWLPRGMRGELLRTIPFFLTFCDSRVLNEIRW
jgi:hypothetical protein